MSVNGVKCDAFCCHGRPLLWERGEVVLFACGAQPVTFANLTSGKPHLDGLITDFLLDQTVLRASLVSQLFDAVKLWGAPHAHRGMT